MTASVNGVASTPMLLRFSCAPSVPVSVVTHVQLSCDSQVQGNVPADL